MDSWPNITRTSVIRSSRRLGMIFLAAAALSAVLAIAGIGSWFYPVGLGILGGLALIGAWSAQRDQIHEDQSSRQSLPADRHS